MNLQSSLRRLFPETNNGLGPIIGQDYEAGYAPRVEGQRSAPIITAWHPQWPKKDGENYPDQPTPGQLAAVSIPSPVEQARDTAKAAFAALPAGKQALWEPVRAAVDAALVKGDGAAAVQIIQTVPEIYDGMETDRAMFLTLFGVASNP